MAQTNPARPAESGNGSQDLLTTSTGQPLPEAIEQILQRTYSPEEEAEIERTEQAEQLARQALGEEYQRLLQHDPALRAALGTRTFADIIDEDRGER